MTLDFVLQVLTFFQMFRNNKEIVLEFEMLIRIGKYVYRAKNLETSYSCSPTLPFLLLN